MYLFNCMNNNDQKIISIGWDAGGWYGDKNAFTTMEYRNGIIIQRQTNILDFKKEDAFIDIDNAIVNKILEPIKSILNSDVKIIIAIDAPLSFSKNFRQLIERRINLNAFSNLKKNNSIAFRTTEIIINNEFKDCLSAVFDSIGNPSTLAQVVMLKLKALGFKYLPIDSIDYYQNNKDDNKIIIEVYPGVLRGREYYKETQAVEMNEKFKSKNYEDCIKYYSDLNSGSKPKSLEMDEFDSILCSLLGLSFAKSFYGDKSNDIPLLEMETRIDSKYVADAAQEGWIYYPKFI